MNRIIYLVAALLLLAYASTCRADTMSSLEQVSVQGVLNVGELYDPGFPAQNGLRAVSGQIIKVYYLQLPAPLGKQLSTQKITPSIASEFPMNSDNVIMVDVGWPDNDPKYNPFGFSKKVGKRLKVYGSLSSDFRAPQIHLSPVFLKATKVEVLKSFNTYGW